MRYNISYTYTLFFFFVLCLCVFKPHKTIHTKQNTNCLCLQIYLLISHGSYVQYSLKKLQFLLPVYFDTLNARIKHTHTIANISFFYTNSVFHTYTFDILMHILQLNTHTYIHTYTHTHIHTNHVKSRKSCVPSVCVC